jgi:hypothetical protein
MSGAGVATGAAVWGAATAPVISWDNTNQVLVVDFDESSVVAGNIAYVQFFSDAGLTTLVSTAVVVLDAANILSGILNVVAGLGAGTYYARAFVSGSSWSNTATVTITSGGSVPTFYILGF